MIKKNLLLLVMMAALFEGSAFAIADTDYLKQSEKALSEGHVYVAQDLLKKAEKNSVTPSDRWLINIIFADTLLRSGQIKLAEEKLISIYDAVETSQNLSLISEVMQRFGHIATARNKNQQSAEWYQKAVNTAEQAGDKAQTASALINLSKVNHDKSLLDRASVNIQLVTEPQTKQQLLLSLGYQAGQFGQLQLAQQSLQAVLAQPVSSRFKSQALGYQADLYLQQLRIDDALKLTEQAQLSDSSLDLQLEWSWKRARLLLKKGRYLKSLSAYRNAVQLLQQSRVDFPVMYTNGESSFNQTFSPLYTEYIELLLQQTEQADTQQQQQLLTEVLQIWEQLKAVELQDYFKNTCTVKQQLQSNIIEADTAVLYPITLSNRMVLVVQFSDQIKAYSIDQSPAQIKTIVKSLNDAIYMGDSIVKHSQVLHQWLIAPVKVDLEQHKIKTLVYLPDGALRKIPFALLYDGQQYLTEQYALVTVPGLSLLAAQSKSTNKSDILLAGMSEPGGVVEELFEKGINIFEESTEDLRGLTEKLPLRKLKIRQGSERKITNRNLQIEQLKKDLALPGVSKELKILSELSQVNVMENNNFLLGKFIKSVHRGHSMVHIASHGYFSGDPEKSFIMTHDHLLNMKQLSELFQNEAVNNQPVELVTLSACQTAEGDDRSPLGLSGVVVQTGVKSAIGTLWPVADEAAQQFFSDFYKYYQQPGTTKAQAVQKAQLGLIKNKKLNHPFYWAPFVLVGEWH
ncbi:MAG: CHAT domain-containing protein [Methylococcales bacterium]|nr:CHAT domain-containing protein [Methylococcales bacterium]